MDRQTIVAILGALNAVEVRGKKNLELVLGCIDKLEAALMAQQSREEHNGHHHNA